jgi:predicted GIY-YIG superfamily endonuclease
MYIVYILTSKVCPDKCYIGLTQNLEKRLQEHNSNESFYAARYRPWQIETYITFNKKEKAQKFERYLKSGSGFAFLKKRFI